MLTTAGILCGSAHPARADDIADINRQLSAQIDQLQRFGIDVPQVSQSAIVLAFNVLNQLNAQILNTQAAFLKQQDSPFEELNWIRVRIAFRRFLGTLAWFGVLFLWGAVVLKLAQWKPDITEWRRWMILAWVTVIVATVSEMALPDPHEKAFIELRAPLVYSINKLRERVDRLEWTQEKESAGYLDWWERMTQRAP